jgi:HK97 family phage major capsid protein
MDDNNEIKTGNRNNSEDRQRIREARAHAQAIDAITREMEPTDSDDEMMTIEERVMQMMDGKALRVKVAQPTPTPEINRPAMDEAVKRARPTAELVDPGYRVLGVPFGGPISGRDRDGEAFHAETQVWLEAGQEVNLTYYHGYGPDYNDNWQNPPVLIGKAEYLGMDERGHWFDPRLDPDEPLAQRLLVNPELVRASSGAVSHLVRMGAAGMIDVWPVGELALFDTNDWRLPANDYAVCEMKKSAEVGAQPQDAAEAGEAPQPAPAADATGPQITEPVLIEDTKEFVMDENELKSIVAALTAELKPAIQAAVSAEVKALSDEPAGKLGGMLITHQAPAVMKNANLGDPDPVEDFYNYVLKGESRIKKHTVKAELPNGRGGTYKAALQEGADDEGGYLVPAGELGRIIEKRDEVALLPKLGVAQFTTDRDVYNIPTEGTAMTRFVIVAEEGDVSAAENEPTLGQAATTLYKFQKMIKLSEEILEDYNSGLETFLSNGIGRAWAITDNYYMQIGNGTTQPQGVFVGGTAGLTLDAAAAIAAGEVPELMGKLKEAYLPGAAMLMKRTTKAYLAGLTGNQFVFAGGDPTATLYDALSAKIGFPVFGTEDCAAIGAGNKSMLFGNFGFYGWVRNRSLQIKRFVELYGATGQIGIRATFRAGAKVLQAEALQYSTHPTA